MNNGAALQWVDLNGRWDFGMTGYAKYLGNANGIPIPYGLALCNGKLVQGIIKAAVNFPSEVTEARILFGYNPDDASYFTAGIGGWGYGYTIQEFVPNSGWIALKRTGQINNILPNKDYRIEVRVYGSRIVLSIDGIELLEHVLSKPFSGEQIGVFATGNAEIMFKDYSYSSEMGDAFVVMQFSEPYNSLYKEVIAPVTSEFRLNPYRVDDVYGPGAILNDIIGGLVESKIIIAEITPPNQNVFYELGYAHALAKPTILLAERGKDLPFDIRGYRVIFYEDSIAGKKNVENDLRKHLKAILRRN